MDPDEQQRQNKKIDFLQRYFPTISHVFSAIWLRLPFQANYGRYTFILGCRYNFLLPFRIFLAFFYILVQIYKQI